MCDSLALAFRIPEWPIREKAGGTPFKERFPSRARSSKTERRKLYNNIVGSFSLGVCGTAGCQLVMLDEK